MMKRREFLSGSAAIGVAAALHGNASAFGRLGDEFGTLGDLGRAGTIAAPQLVLPAGAGSPLAVYSARKLSTYSGPWAQALRASDSATQNISFGTNNAPDTAAIATFRGGSSLTTNKYYDQSGNGLDATSFGASFNPGMAATNILGGIQAVTFAGAPASTLGTLSLPAGLTTSSQNVSMFMVLAPMGSYQNCAYGGLGTANPTFFDMMTLQSPTGFASFDGSSVRGMGAVSKAVRCQPCVIGITGTAASIAYYVDQLTGSSVAPALLSMAGGTLGRWPKDNSLNGAFDLLALVVYTALDATNSQAVIAALNAAFPGTARSALRNMVYDGDSIMWGAGTVGAGSLQNLPRLAEPSYNFPVNSWNMALSGSTLATRVSGYSALVAPLYDGTKTRNVFHQQAGTNDIVAGTTAATLQTLIQNNASAARATGFKFGFSTILPRTSFTAPMQTEWNAYNTWARANWASFADYLADFANDPTMGPIAAASSTTLYPDGTHPGAVGNGILAPILAAAVNTVL